MTNGDFYIGEFKKNKYDGKGKYFWAYEKDMFEGEFLDGKICEGNMKCSIGVDISGRFKSNRNMKYDIKNPMMESSFRKSIITDSWIFRQLSTDLDS